MTARLHRVVERLDLGLVLQPIVDVVVGMERDETFHHLLLGARVLSMARRLIAAPDGAAVIGAIEAALREDFDAAQSVLVLTPAGAPPGVVESRFLRVVAAEAPDLRSFETLFSAGKPRCGQLRDSQREFLFGADAPEVGSVALVPLGSKGSLGLLACGSHDLQRFNPTMSTDFLAHIGELIAAALA